MRKIPSRNLLRATVDLRTLGIPSPLRARPNQSGFSGWVCSGRRSLSNTDWLTPDKSRYRTLRIRVTR